jgi:mannose/cellobiose epimerase-like protein (N-acyl-D-glucosamine 2-epimerase family)
VTTEHEAARAVLDEIRLRTENEDAQVAALVAFARRAKAEALREAANRVCVLPVPTDTEHTPSEEQRYHWAVDDAVDAIRALAAKLDGGSDGPV